MIRLLAFCLTLVAFAASAEVFTYTDAQGNRVYTDQPRGDAKRIQLTTSNRMPAASAGKTSPAVKNPMPEPTPFRYDMLRVLIPEPDATIRSSAGELIVSVTSEPGLQPGHRYRLLLDGQATGEPGPSPVFPLSNIDRGSHNLSVEILDGQGRTVERTANQPFHMQRISLAQKRQVKPCAKDDYGVRPECPLKDKPPEPKNPFLRFF
ncbi:DUF4124 domain-containing protein [Pseudomonas sp. COR58]|uniref:DUF4124 domain-containing protein n=1 Tax=Pseudomonas ekonensis TaxID=2842353 RepID=A0ABS6PJZ3_9PSED|nr:DUF4124 domain-containing protein [Pseudomonas ekonensis]MBV4460797.1 DUF4124 domain-containing protein [Pseudomonas ekonensis]